MKMKYEFAAAQLNICKVVSFQPLFDFLQKKCKMFPLTQLPGEAFINKNKILHHIGYLMKSLNKSALCQEEYLLQQLSCFIFFFQNI